MNLQDYVRSAGQGTGDTFGGFEDAASVQELAKALEAGAITGRETTGLQVPGSGAPLKIESLDQTLKYLTFTEKNINIWQKIPKKQAYNTVEQYNQLQSVGSEYMNSFNLEGELPQEDSSLYVRRAQTVKYMGSTRSVTHPMQLMRLAHNIEAITQENKLGTLKILRDADRALTIGDETVNAVEWNGMYAQHFQSLEGTLEQYFNDPYVIDLRGQPLTETVINRIAAQIIEGFGVCDMGYLPPAVLARFQEQFYGNKRFIVNGQGNPIGDATVGQKAMDFIGPFGPIKLDWDIFLNRRPNRLATSPAVGSPTNSPLSPVAGTALGGGAVAAGADALSRFIAADGGNYFYAVAAANNAGESPLTVLNSAAAVTVAAGQSVDLSFAAANTGPAATSFIIYRSQRNAALANAVFSPIFRIGLRAQQQGYDGGAGNIVRDRNRFLPNTDQAFFLQSDNQVWEFGQLAPLMKMDLATLAPAYRWMILMYGTPFLYARQKMIRLINIGLG